MAAASRRAFSKKYHGPVFHQWLNVARLWLTLPGKAAAATWWDESRNMAGPEPQMQTDAPANLPELSRQVGNSYALLRSIIRRSAETATGVDSLAWHMEGRLDAIGRIMLALIREPGTSFDLCHLIEDELTEQQAIDSASSWSLNGPPVTMNAAAAQVLGLLFHELVTNSIEHGMLGGEDGGELQVNWRIEPGAGDGMLRLDWIERGAPARMDREGFGSLVLDGMLRYQLDGTAEREMGPGGVRISIAVPMRRLVEDDAAPGFA